MQRFLTLIWCPYFRRLGLPVLYWRINAGLYTAATGTSLGSGPHIPSPLELVLV
ncbi:MAG: hypothetical protein IPG18_18585 [Saprospiraceae bacterium]|nr:hypothetical protein [Saprospiraceae bacterium]